MKIKPSIIVSVLASLSLMCSCADAPSAPTLTERREDEVILGRTEDMGDEYIEGFLFFGESTTYHLKSRGILPGGKNTEQVLHDESGTAILNDLTSTMTVINPKNHEKMPFGEAVETIRPKYMLLTFGLNGAVGKIKLGEEYYKSCYRKLIVAIRASSPDTKIILGSCYPVASNMDTTAYSVTQKELNEYIRTINGWTVSLAAEEGLRYLNVNEVLTDGEGDLRLEYQCGDGHHLTREAYVVILEYIRTHGYK